MAFKLLRKWGKEVQLAGYKVAIPERWTINSKTSMISRGSLNLRENQATLRSRVKKYMTMDGRDRGT